VVDDDIADLLPNYVAARRRDVATLRERLDGGDLPGIARLAHQMKGSGDGYGLPMVSRLGKAIEDAARAGDAHTIGPLIHDLDRRLAKLRIRTADGRISMEL
jgi:HPt (histidine-containing phosphotransfer) domain-containing protein